MKRFAIVLLITFVLTIVMIGCGSGGISEVWNVGTHNGTGVVPTVGTYSVVTTTNITDARHRQFGLRVGVDPKNKKLSAFFSADMSSWYSEPIVNGTVRIVNGQLNGKHCPTDSFAASFHFTKPDKAEGKVQIANNCNEGPSARFTAILQ